MERITAVLLVLLLTCPIVFAGKAGGDRGAGQNTTGQERKQLMDQIENESKQLMQERKELKNQSKAELKNLTQERKQVKNQTKAGLKNLTQERRQLRNQSKNESKQLQQEMKQLRNQTKEALKQIMEERRQLMDRELQNFSNKNKQNVYRNQNTVRLAVHTLLAMENRTRGIGRNVSQIAREFNNSVQATLRAEERIQSRNKIMRFLFGGDGEAAEEIGGEVDRNRERVGELKRLREDCDCDEETVNVLGMQIQNIEREQNRLRALAQKERESRGLLGWLWK